MADTNFPPGQGATASESEDAARLADTPETPEDLRAYPAPGASAPAAQATAPMPDLTEVPVAPEAGQADNATPTPYAGTAQSSTAQSSTSQPNAPEHLNAAEQPNVPEQPKAPEPSGRSDLDGPQQPSVSPQYLTPGDQAPERAAQGYQAEAYPAQSHPTQGYPTQVLPDAFGKPAPQAQPAAHQSPDATAAKRGHSTGTFLAGLAVAALIGGIVGGGVSSLVVANSQPRGGSVSQQSGTVTLNNPETATEISGVAMVGTPSVVTLSVSSQTEGGSGSGVIYSADGYIITNAHVVTLDGAASDPQIRVKHSDGRVFDGTLVGVAPYSDIAVVKIEAEGLTPIEVADSSKVNVGDLAVAIGAPMSLANTVTSGVVSALNRGISVGSALIPQDPSQEGQEDPQDDGTPDSGRGFPWDFRFDTPGETQNPQQSGGQVTLPVVQTDASINPGNSGGALLNARAELIGINVAIASPGATEGNASSAGLGFAIPADLATRVADEIIAGAKPSHGLLGASVVDSSQDTDADANHAGGLIKELVRGGAAAKAGLKIGDVITAVNGVPAADGTSVSALIRMHAGESEVAIDYTRGGVAGQVSATLGTLDW